MALSVCPLVLVRDTPAQGPHQFQQGVFGCCWVWLSLSVCYLVLVHDALAQEPQQLQQRGVAYGQALFRQLALSLPGCPQVLELHTLALGPLVLQWWGGWVSLPATLAV